jgi:predicted ATPase
VHALGYVAAKKRSSTEQLRESIGDQPMLIVLDNCEHLIEEVAALVIELLGSCSQLKILATSRESLRVPGEWLYSVPSLNVPKENASLSMGGVAEFPALTLFAERARAVRPDFVLDNNNIGAVSALCTQLDGLPLAIELIAARVRLMSPQTLLDQMNDQFPLFSDGMRAATPRHKTLHNAIDWSGLFWRVHGEHG